MAGTIVRAVPKTTFDFSGVPHNGGSVTLPVAKGLDVREWRELVFIARFHDASADFKSSLGLVVSIVLRFDAPTEEDGQDFVGSGSSTQDCFYSGDPIPEICAFSPQAPYPSFVRLYVKGTNNQAFSGVFSVTISVDMNGRA